MRIEFKEEQKFDQWWLWVILIPIGVLPLYGIYKQLILGEEFGDNPMSDAGLIIFAIFIFGLVIFFGMIRLRTEIDNNEIRMNFFPLFKKKVNWKEIKNAEIVNYGFVGFGIRLGTKFGTVYNIKGNTGLSIELLNGEKFLIGTRKEAELNEIVKKARGQQQL